MNTKTLCVLDISSDGEPIIDNRDRKNDGPVSADEWKECVGGYGAVVVVARIRGWSYEIVVHDEGLLLNLPINPIASMFDILRGGQGLVGPALLQKSNEEGDSFPCSYEEFSGAVATAIASHLRPKATMDLRW